MADIDKRSQAYLEAVPAGSKAGGTDRTGHMNKPEWHGQNDPRAHQEACEGTLTRAGIPGDLRILIRRWVIEPGLLLLCTLPLNPLISVTIDVSAEIA